MDVAGWSAACLTPARRAVTRPLALWFWPPYMLRPFPISGPAAFHDLSIPPLHRFLARTRILSHHGGLLCWLGDQWRHLPADGAAELDRQGWWPDNRDPCFPGRISAGNGAGDPHPALWPGRDCRHAPPDRPADAGPDD